MDEMSQEDILSDFSDDFAHVDMKDVELYFAEFQKLSHLDVLTSPVQLDEVRLPWADVPKLVESCHLMHFDESAFEQNGVANALYKFSQVAENEVSNAQDETGPDLSGQATGDWCERLMAQLHGGTPSNEVLLPFRDQVQLGMTFKQFVIAVSMAKAEELEPRKTPIFPFDPESTGKQTWDGVIMIFLLYTTFAVPYFLSFGESTSGDDTAQEWGAYETFDLFLDTLFCLDVIANFCTAFISRGIYVTDMRLIAIHYLKTWFLLDFFGSVPFDKVVSAITTGTSGNMQSTLRALRLVRILKIVRAVRFLSKLNQLKQRDTTGALKTIVSVFRASFLLVFAAHLLACLFYLLIDKSSTDNWLYSFDPSSLDFENTSNDVRYVLGFYWAVITICTVGYGDILPVNHYERIFALISALIGGICFSVSAPRVFTLVVFGTTFVFVRHV